MLRGRTRPAVRGAQPVSTEEFCGEYKGQHTFEEGANQCRCGRAYLRAPRPEPWLLPRPNTETCSHGIAAGFTCFSCVIERQNVEKPEEHKTPEGDPYQWPTNTPWW